MKKLLIAGLIMLMPISLMAEEVIKIGVIAPLDNPTGRGIRNAVEMAAEEINAKGGILGKKIAIIVSDTKLKSPIAAYEYTRLATQEKAVAVIGTCVSEDALAIIEQVPKHKVLFLPTGTASPEITEKIRQNYDALKYVFRVCHNSHEIAEFSSEWMITELVKKRGFKNISLMIENAAWARPIAVKWAKELKAAGANVPVFEYFYKETKDFKPMFTRMMESRSEAISVISAHVSAEAYMEQWVESKGPLMVGMTGTFPTTWKATDGKASSLISMFFTGIFGLNAADKAFCNLYREKYKVIPEYPSPYSYDALHLLKDAIERAKSVEADTIVDAMEKTDYKGVMGRWVFDKVSHHSKFGPGYRQFIIVQWQPDEKVCVIYPDENKTCEMIFPQWK